MKKINTESELKSTVKKGFIFYVAKTLFPYIKTNFVPLMLTGSITATTVAGVGGVVTYNKLVEKDQEIHKLQEEVKVLKDPEPVTKVKKVEEVKVIPVVKEIKHQITTYEGDIITGVLMGQTNSTASYKTETGEVKTISREDILKDVILP